jgi:ribosome maturation factor RimP
MGPIEERLMRLLEPTITAMGYELLGLEYVGQGKHSRLRLYIDGPSGIGVGDCEAVSHQASGILDVEDPIKGQYSLEVSSPGLDRPLFKPGHFAKFLGHQVKLRTRLAIGGQRNFQGEIQAVENDDIYISIENGEQLKLAGRDIERANLIPEF